MKYTAKSSFLLIIVAFLFLLSTMTPLTYWGEIVAATSYESDLEIFGVSIPDPIIEGELIVLTITVKNNGTSVLPGSLIEVRLYIDDATSPTSVNSTTDGLLEGNMREFNLTWTAELGDHLLHIRLYLEDILSDQWDVSRTVVEKDVDLKIYELSIETPLQLKEPTYLFVNITNSGKNTSSDIDVSLFVNEVLYHTTVIEGLAKGTFSNITFEWIPTLFGPQTINITIDPQNTIEEYDETNNYYESVIYVEAHKLDWWDSNWHYRQFFAINGTGNVSTVMNFTQLLENLGITNKTMENSTLSIVEYDTDGTVDDIISSYQFNESELFDNVTNAIGVLTWNVTEDPGYYYIYFDTQENLGEREVSEEVVSIVASGNASVQYSNPVEGWWVDIEEPSAEEYPLNRSVSLEILTMAKASNLTLELSREGSYIKTLVPDTTDNSLWFDDYIFSQEGNWSIVVNTTDNSGYEPKNQSTVYFRVSAYPDIAVVTVFITLNEVIEGEAIEIFAIVNNTGEIDAVNYQMRLYLSQDTLTWESNQLKNTSTIDVEKNETKLVSLTWDPALFGDPSKEGNWTAGIWVYTNSTYKDSNTSNNRGTNASIRVVEGEKNPPTIELTEITDPQEREQVVTIKARIIDESGIKIVNISISNPEQDLFNYTMNQQSGNIYVVLFDETTLVGDYNFTITAKDNSFYENTSTLHGTFEIIQDATPPTIEYLAAKPKVQLKGEDVTVVCIAQDNYAVHGARITMIDPEGHESIETMVESDTNKFVFKDAYEIIGKYEFYVFVTDDSDNEQESDHKTFWITTDLDDTDNDGMPDWWEKRYGFDPYDPSDAQEDYDDDDSSNLQEYIENTNPLKSQTLNQQFISNIEDNLLYFIVSIILFSIVLLLASYGFRRSKP